MKLEFPRRIFEKYSNTKFHEHPPSGSPAVSCRQTDWHGEANSRFFFFLIFGTRPKKQILSNPDTAPHPHPPLGIHQSLRTKMPVKRYSEIHYSLDIPRQISVDIQWRYIGVSLNLTYRYVQHVSKVYYNTAIGCQKSQELRNVRMVLLLFYNPTTFRLRKGLCRK